MSTVAVVYTLSARQAKSLRYVVTARVQPVTPDRLVVKTAWSDLPHSMTAALRTLVDLHKLGQVERVGKNQYTPTEEGIATVKIMSTEKMFQAPPAPAVTNKRKAKKKGKQ